MQIVIEIDEREWMDEKNIREVAFEYKKGSGFDRAIREGLRQAIVLPKGHGRLIDADELRRTMEKDVRRALSFVDLTDFVWLADTIIEADKAKE